MPSTDLLIAALDLAALEKRRPEVKQYFDEIRAAYEKSEDEPTRKKKYPELCKVFKASLNHDAREQAQKLLDEFPHHPLLRLILAQIAMNLKDVNGAAAILYRLEADGAPEEVMLEMKARFCSATADESRTTKLKDKLNQVIETKEKVERETNMTATAASSLTWAWIGSLAGFSLAVIGFCGCLIAQTDTERFLYAFLGVFGLLLLAPSVWWIRKNNRVLQELKVYEEGKV
ncbi:MAG: hypothetical protein KIS92_14855 [Planctomycetota bacterium]|nr:hypothetical protein [Planctomycetota bacterium]